MDMTKRLLAAGIVLCLCASAVFADAVKVGTVTASEKNVVRDLRLSGSVTADKFATLSSEVAGLVRQLHADIGDHVDAGQLLLTLDDGLTRIDRDQARAEALRAREVLADSERRLSEARSLQAQNNISASEVRALEAQVRIDRASLASARAQLEKREAELQRHQIHAPFAGHISDKLTDAGQWVNPGDGMLELANTDRLWIDVPVPQRFFPAIDNNTVVELTTDAWPDTPFTGSLYRKVPVSRPDSRTFLLRLKAVDDTPALIPGMSVNAVVRLDTGQRRVAVPRDALVRHPDGRVTVWQVLQQDGRPVVTEQVVKTGQTFGAYVAVEQGLEAGRQIVVRGNEALYENQPVKIINNDG